MRIYDESDTEIRAVSLPLSLGEQTTEWDGKDNDGKIVSPGEYSLLIEGKRDGQEVQSPRHRVTVVKVEMDVGSPIKPGTGDEPETSPVTVTISPSGIPDLKIKIKADVYLKSGGHSHESTTSKRPTPRIKTPSDEWNQVYEFPVSSDKIETTFRPSMGANNTKRGIAGKYKIEATWPGVVNVSKDIEVKYDLKKLEAGTNYHLRTADPNHNSGDYHYGTTAANQAIEDAADKFMEDYGNDYTPNRKMIVNDQSLVWGGLFDINGNWDAPHETHRDGRNVDIPYAYYRGYEVGVDVDSEEWNLLKEALDEKFGEANVSREDDKNHFHCTK